MPVQTDPTPESGELPPTQPATAQVERPTSVEASFVMWMVLGGLTVLSGLGIAILVAGFALRAGSRTGRTVLTMIGVALGLPMLLGPVVWTLFVGEAWVLFLMMVLFVPGAVFVAATVLMWGRNASAYFRAVRGT